MTQLGDLFAAGKVALTKGEIRTDAATLADDVEVLIPEWSTAETRTAAGWMPRGAVLPSYGDPCLVGVDDDGEAWILVWSPG